MPLDSALLTSIAQEIFAPAALSGIAIVAAWLGLLLGLAEWLHRARNQIGRASCRERV